MKVKRAADIMTCPVVTIGPKELLVDAIKVLLRHHCSGLPVVDETGGMIGIITEHDIMNLSFSGEAADTRVEQAMTKKVIAMPPDAEMTVLAECLGSHRIRRVPIVQGGKVVGIVSRRDILREMLFMYSKFH